MMFEGIANFASLVNKARQVQGKMSGVQEQLKKIRVEGTAGGDMVVVEMNGQQEAIGCRIDPSLVQSGDVEMLEDLLVSAINQANERAKAAAAQEMSKLMEGVDMSGMGDMLSKFGLGKPQ